MVLQKATKNSLEWIQVYGWTQVLMLGVNSWPLGILGAQNLVKTSALVGSHLIQGCSLQQGRPLQSH